MLLKHTIPLQKLPVVTALTLITCSLTLALIAVAAG